VRPGSLSWWSTKVRQALRHVRATVPARERDTLLPWLTPAQLALFESMHMADRRHGLDVSASLRAAGETDPDVLLAGLLHDAGKGQTGILPRVVYALGGAYGRRIEAPFRRLGMATALDRLAAHAATSAALAEGAGCPPRTVELIRWQEEPRDPDAGERLRLADEAN